MSAPSHWTFGESTLRRIVEYEGPILSPFEIFGDCTQEHLDQNRAWLVPRFQDATSGILIITIQSFLIRRNGLTVARIGTQNASRVDRRRASFSK